MKTFEEMIEKIGNEIEQEFGFANEDTIVAIKEDRFETDTNLSNKNYYETNGYKTVICPKDADVTEWLNEFFNYLDQCKKEGR